MQHNTTKFEPFYLTYRRKATLPIDCDNTTTKEEDKINILLERTHQLITQLKRDRFKAKENVTKSQQQQEQRHNKKLKETYIFIIGEQVLLYKSHLHNKRKLEDRWKGPYYIHDTLGNGAYKLRTLDRKVLKIPINSERLKLYHQRPLPEPYVLIEG